jgi:hypothetical protein
LVFPKPGSSLAESRLEALGMHRLLPGSREAVVEPSQSLVQNDAGTVVRFRVSQNF